MLRKSLLALLPLLVLHSGSAFAEDVAVLGTEMVKAPASMAARITAALKDRVKRTGTYTLIPGKDIEEIKLVFGCVSESPACLAKAGKSLKADWLSWASLQKKGAGYLLTIKWLSVKEKRLAKQVQRQIAAIQDDAKAIEVIGELTASFLPSATGSVRITTNVEGASITIDGKPMGETAATPRVLLGIPAGPRALRISREGYQPYEETIIVAVGQASEVNAQLQKVGGDFVTPPPVVKSSRRTGWKVAFWTGAAVTVGLAVGLGITGSKVLSAEEDKDNAIAAFRDPQNGMCSGASCNTAFSTDDVCAEAEGVAGAEGVRSACSDGDKYATMTNALIGTAVGVAAISGFFYYKAYIAKESAEEEPSEGDDEEESSEEELIETSTSRALPSPAWMVSPSLSPNGAGFGLQFHF